MENNERYYLEKQVKEESKSALELVIREGACRMLQAAIENEIDEYIERFKDARNMNRPHSLWPPATSDRRLPG